MCSLRFFLCVFILDRSINCLSDGQLGLGLNITNDTSWPLNADESCRQSCGNIKAACSCDHRCLIYGNCCEDIGSECPHILQDSRERFSHLLDADVACLNDVFVIASCPRDVNETLEQRGNQEEEIFESPIMNVTDLIDFLFDASKKALVSDINTGFVYKNKSIFDCNARNDSIPARWDLQPQSNDLSYIGLFNRKTIFFVPPENQSTSTQPLACCPDAIQTCRNNSGLLNTWVDKKCREIISYVTLLGSRKYTKIYKNRYCAVCNNEERSKIFTYKKFFGKYDYPLIVSLNPNKFLIKFSQKKSKRRFSWSSVICSVDKINLTSIREVEHDCQIETCHNSFFMQPDGSCKRKYYVEMAFSERLLPQMIGKKEQVSKLIECYFQHVANYSITGNLKSKEFRYNQHISTPFFVFRFDIFSGYSDYSILNLMFVQSLSVLLNVLQNLFNNSSISFQSNSTEKVVFNVTKPEKHSIIIRKDTKHGYLLICSCYRTKVEDDFDQSSCLFTCQNKSDVTAGDEKQAVKKMKFKCSKLLQLNRSSQLLNSEFVQIVIYINAIIYAYS